MRRGYLGIGTQSVRLPADLRERLGQRAGLIVISVEPGSPAASGGLALGDILLKFGGEAVYRPGQLRRNSTRRGSKALAAELLRGGEVRELSVTVGERT